MRRRRSPDASAVWFIKDEAIDDEAKDAFAHNDVALQIAEIIRTTTPPATIGLLGPFGVGKSSVGRLLRNELDADSKYSVVQLSAEKHTDVARQRALVFSFAEALIDCGVADREIVDPILGRVEHDEEVEEVGELGGVTFIRRHWRALADGLIVTAGIMLAIYLLGVLIAILLRSTGRIDDNVFAWPVTTAFSWLVIVAGVVGGTGAIGLAIAGATGKTLLKILSVPGSVRRSTPRAEAADELERVFGKLAELAHDRQLVIVVDDVDRLPASEVLAALGALKTFQAVPPKHPPFFVIACDERIIRQALTDTQAAASPAGGDNTNTARAFLDKAFTIRQPLPPHIPQDMHSYALRRLTDPDLGHAGASALGDDLSPVLDVLIHDGVTAPREVLHLVNAFFADYRLAVVRESSATLRLAKGDVTGYPVELARLTVLKVDFPDQYAAIVEDTETLAALDAVAAGEPPTEAQRDLIRPEWGDTHRPDEDGLVLADSALSNFLTRTRAAVDHDVPLLPMLYLRSTEAVGVLGSRRAERVRSALVNNRPAELVELLQDEETSRAAFEHARDQIRRVRVGLNLDNSIASCSAALPDIPEAFRTSLADELAHRLRPGEKAHSSPSALANIARFCSPINRSPFIARAAMAEDDEPREVSDERASAVWGLAEIWPEDDRLVQSMNRYFDDRLPDGHGWTEASAWLDRACEASEEQRSRFAGAHFFAAVLRVAAGSSEVTDAQGTALVTLLQSAAESDRSAPEVWAAALACVHSSADPPKYLGLRVMEAVPLPAEGSFELVVACCAILAEYTGDLASMAFEALASVASRATDELSSAPEELLTALVESVSPYLEEGVDDHDQRAAVQVLEAWAATQHSGLAPLIAAASPTLQEHRNVSDATGAAVRDALIAVSRAAIHREQASNILTADITTDYAPDSPQVLFDLETLPRLFFAAGPDEANRLCDQWASLMESNPPVPMNMLTLVKALRVAAVEGVLNEVVASRAVTRLVGYTGYPDTASICLATAPWPAPERPRATEAIWSMWAELGGDTQRWVIHGVSEWPLADGEVTASLTDAVTDWFCSADSEALHWVQGWWPSLAGAQRARIVGSRVGDSPFLDGAARDLAEPELREAFDQALTAERFTTLAETVGAGDLSGAAASPVALALLTGSFDETETQPPDEAYPVLAALLDSASALELTAEAASALGRGRFQMNRAVTILAALSRTWPGAIAQSADVLAESVNEHLSGASGSDAEALGRSLKDIGIAHFNTLDRLRGKGASDDEKLAAEAFQRGHRSA